jgi:hypothetical protein
MAVTLDIHAYDGQLREVKKFLDADIVRVKNIDKRSAFMDLRNILSLPPHLIGLYDSIVTGSPQSNYEPTNDLDAQDLLYICWERKDKDIDIIPLLKMAFEDMLTGMCPSGRATRLFQVLVSLT